MSEWKSPYVSHADMRKVAARHSDIPQDSLPGLENVRDESRSKQRDPSKQKTVPSIRRAKCPQHKGKGDDDLTGVVINALGTEVFREHTKRVGSHSLRCPGSGTLAPDE